MKRFNNLLLFSFILFLSFDISAQTKDIDSLKNFIRSAGSDENKINAIFSLCEIGYSVHPDTLMLYADDAQKIAVKLNNLHDQVRAMYYKSSVLTTKGLIDSSLHTANRCLDFLSGKINDPELQSNLYNQKGRCFMRKNQYKEAIEMGYLTINTAEKANAVLVQVKGKTLIGWAYLEMGQNKESLEWHLKALHTTADSLLLQKYAILFANLALNYQGLGKTDSAFYFIDLAVNYARRHENLFALSNSLAIRSQLYIRAGKPQFAEENLKEAVAIRKLIGDPFYIVSDMSQLGLFYAHNDQPEKGIAICKEGIDLAKKFNIDTKLLFLYNSLGENYKLTGDQAGYANVLEKIISLKDVIYQKNSAEALVEIQAKYDLQKKENLIIRQNLAISRQHYLFYGLVLFLFFSVVVAGVLFREYKKRQQIKMEKMQEDEKQLALLAVMKAEENERKRIAADLHDNMGAYAASIASNLDQVTYYLKDDTGSGALQELKNNSQAIVSQLNDTIWVMKKDNLSLTAISDRLKVFIQRLRASYPKINIDVTEHIHADLLMPPSQAFHLFRIMQEAVINALKHSRANTIAVCFESGASWKITVSDDGIGITSQQKQMSSGNGLLNMKNRARETGWKIHWQGNKPQGTNVIIEPTTN